MNSAHPVGSLGGVAVPPETIFCVEPTCTPLLKNRIAYVGRGLNFTVIVVLAVMPVTRLLVLSTVPLAEVVISSNSKPSAGVMAEIFTVPPGTSPQIDVALNV